MTLASPTRAFWEHDLEVSVDHSLQATRNPHFWLTWLKQRTKKQLELICEGLGLKPRVNRRKELAGLLLEHKEDLGSISVP